MTTLAAACLVVAVATEAAPLTKSLCGWLGRVSHTRPFELRLQLNDWYHEGVLAARAVTAELPGDSPIVVDNRGGPEWFLALRLQPRRVYFDRPAVRAHLTATGEPFGVVHLERVDGATRWWVASHNGTGQGSRTGSAPPTIRVESFEEGLEGWTTAGDRDGGP